MFKAIALNPGAAVDVTPIIGDVSWSSSVDTYAQSAEFSMARSIAVPFPINPLTMESGIQFLVNGEDIFKGKILYDSQTGNEPISYRAMDPYFYLNQSDGIYQFRGEKSSDAITRIFKDFQIPIGSIVNIPLPVKQIYNGQKLTAIIKDILDKAEKATGIKYLAEARGGKVYVEKVSDLTVSGTFRMPDGSVLDIVALHGVVTRTRSIEATRNIVKAVNNDKVIAQARNEANSGMYGKLQHVEPVDDQNKSKAGEIVKNLLKELAKVHETISVPMLGHPAFRAHRSFPLVDKTTGISATCKILSVDHSIKNRIHLMKVTLEVVS